MKDIIRAEELPIGEVVYLKKDFLGWRVVEPYKIDGKINWFNFIFGGKRALLALVIILIIGCLLYFGVNELVDTYKNIAMNPCNFCDNCAKIFKTFP